MKTALLVDGNNIMFGAYAALNNDKKGKGEGLVTSTGIRTSMLSGILKSLAAFTETHAVDAAIICHDTSGSRYRKKLFPHYKGNRVYDEDSKVIFEEMDDTRTYLDRLGVVQFLEKGIEADDQIGFYASRYVKCGWEVIIFSNDKDFYQLHSDRIHIWRPCVKKFVDEQDILKEYRVPALFSVYMMALTGQQKDNIPGLCPLDEDGIMQKVGFGPAKAVKIVEPMLEGTSFDDCLDTAIKAGNKWSEYVEKNREQIHLSLALSTIRTHISQFDPQERIKLAQVWVKAIEGTSIRRKSALHVKKMLEFRRLAILSVLKKLGVQII